MSGGFPFGFTPSGSSSGGAGGGSGMPFGTGAPFFAELERLLSWHDGPVNWELARQVAVRTLGDADRAVSEADVEAVRQAIRLADVWLDPVTPLPAGATTAQGWTRGRWIEVTLPVWRTLCDPVAARVADAMRGGISSGLAQMGDVDSGLPPELAAQIPPGIDLSQLASAGGPIIQMINRIGGMLFGAQVGEAIGLLASEVASSTDVGLPLSPARTAALIPANVEAFGSGLEVDPAEVRIYLALREAASQRLYAHVPWLRAHVLGAVEEYARGITVDPNAVSRAMTMLDPSRLMDPASFSEALGSDVFDEATTPEQAAALTRLEMILALVEGWVETVTDAAAVKNLPAAPRLREMIRRRRAEGGPAEQTFATLVGLNLRPRKLREAATLWDAVGEARGIDGRDALWAHPDLLPNTDDLTNPQRFATGDTTSTVGDPISELERLRDTPAQDEPPGPEGTHGTDPPDGPRGGR
ncbi:zinc-dependent metalloprotease [Protofrankia symbiont of Coriaria ruscifolia]|uniref:zinc-dependent metalloprotease n=1 Tax=Protofrankia symbiont of Coriaria ruscifolia TaxID=1306542 RepID=UPI001041BB72|nr:zinc-dependent metalloprotease [Protofrankia symbiont of Coriaria ruscifolia]